MEKITWADVAAASRGVTTESPLSVVEIDGEVVCVRTGALLPAVLLFQTGTPMASADDLPEHRHVDWWLGEKGYWTPEDEDDADESLPGCLPGHEHDIRVVGGPTFGEIEEDGDQQGTFPMRCSHCRGNFTSTVRASYGLLKEVK